MNFPVETRDVSLFFPRRILQLGRRRSSAIGDLGCWRAELFVRARFRDVLGTCWSPGGLTGSVCGASSFSCRLGCIFGGVEGEGLWVLGSVRVEIVSGTCVCVPWEAGGASVGGLGSWRVEFLEWVHFDTVLGALLSFWA